jgi:hypothetical protein
MAKKSKKLTPHDPQSPPKVSVRDLISGGGPSYGRRSASSLPHDVREDTVTPTRVSMGRCCFRRGVSVHDEANPYGD